jgi:hypothetical protein
MERNNQLVVLTHLSQFLDFITGIGGFIVPLIIWLSKKNQVIGMDEHGRAILNFRISMFIGLILCVPLILFFGLGILGFIAIGIFYVIFPIINAIKASNEEAPYYPTIARFF